MISSISGKDNSLSFSRHAQQTLPMVLDAFYQQALFESTDPTTLHKLRIAAKKLRYSLEFFAQIYDKQLTPHLEQIRKLQELLGNIHDCDVMIEFLQKHIPGSRINKAKAVTVLGREQLIAVVQQDRASLVLKFITLWRNEFQEKFKFSLLNIVSKKMDEQTNLS
jgi:CHAD domain-containing protein